MTARNLYGQTLSRSFSAKPKRRSLTGLRRKLVTKMKNKQISFWLNLEVPVEDFLEEEKTDKTAFTRKIFNRLKHESDNWFDILSIKGKTEKETLHKLRDSYQEGKILNAYCCSWFAHKLSNPSLALEFARKIVMHPIKNLEKDDQALVYLIHESDQNSLIDLYYEHFLQKIQMETYISDSSAPSKGTQNLTQKLAQKILNKYESKRKNKHQRSKVWWFKNDKDSWIILFRRSRLTRIPVKEVDRNNFIRTADLKAFKISKDLLSVYVYSKNEPARMAKCASLFAEELARSDMNYSKKERTSKTTEVNDFISSLPNKHGTDVKITEICFQNFPLNDSPTIVLKSQDDEGINASVEQLKEEGKHPGEQNCISIKLKYKGRKFDIRFNRQGDNTDISVNFRGLLHKNRKEISNFLDDALK